MERIDDIDRSSDPEDLAALAGALDTGDLSGIAPVVDAFEAELAERFGVRHALTVASGSAALHASLVALGAGPGTEVVVSALAPASTLLPIRTAGATAVFVDCEPDGFGFDLEDLERVLRSRTRAVIAVQLWGQPVLSTELLALLETRGIPLVEDSAQGHLTRETMGLAGTVGRIGCFSTHQRKPLSTGEGGFTLTDDDALAERLRHFCRLGGKPGERYGVNYKMPALQAALGRSRLRALDDRMERRRANAAWLAERIASDHLLPLPVPPGTRANDYALVLRVRSASRARIKRFVEELDRTAGVPSEVIRCKMRPGYEQPLFTSHRRPCRNAEGLLDCVTTVPTHPGLSEASLEAIVERVRDTERRLLGSPEPRVATTRVDAHARPTDLAPTMG